jgi:hypothetical protein
MAPRAKPADSSSVVIADIARGRGFAVRVSLSEYKGKRFCDLRKIQLCDGGPPIYSKAGCNVRIDQIEALIHNLHRARAEALKLGWLPPAETGAG